MMLVVVVVMLSHPYCYQSIIVSGHEAHTTANYKVSPIAEVGAVVLAVWVLSLLPQLKKHICCWKEGKWQICLPTLRLAAVAEGQSHYYCYCYYQTSFCWAGGSRQHLATGNSSTWSCRWWQLVRCWEDPAGSVKRWWPMKLRKILFSTVPIVRLPKGSRVYVVGDWE